MYQSLLQALGIETSFYYSAPLSIGEPMDKLAEEEEEE
jgi:hypothetical protein